MRDFEERCNDIVDRGYERFGRDHFRTAMGHFKKLGGLQRLENRYGFVSRVIRKYGATAHEYLYRCGEHLGTLGEDRVKKIRWVLNI